jgi:dihydropyrimidinase
MAGLEDWHRRRANACVDVGAHMIVLDAGAATLAEMKTLVEREGISSFKFFMAYPGALMLEDGAMFTALRAAGALGALSCVHAENGPVIQAWCRRAGPGPHGAALPRADAPGAARRRSRTTRHQPGRTGRRAAVRGAPVHRAGPAAVQQARRARGLPVFAETCPQYLLLDDSEYESEGFEGAKYVMSPPIRPASHGPQLWHGLKRGDIQVVATDHCAFTYGEQAARPAPFQAPGAGRLQPHPQRRAGPGNAAGADARRRGAAARHELHRFVDLVATAPARLFGLFPRKGTVAVGSDADLVLFDPPSAGRCALPRTTA